MLVGYRLSLVHRKKRSPCRTISQLTIANKKAQPLSNSFPLRILIRYVPIWGNSAPVISHQFCQSCHSDPSISQRFRQTANDGSTNCLLVLNVYFRQIIFSSAYFIFTFTIFLKPTTGTSLPKSNHSLDFILWAHMLTNLL